MKRAFLIFVGLLGVGSYAWFHITRVFGIPAMVDLPFIIAHTSTPIFILALFVGAAVLWINTRHVAVLLQLIACFVSFVILVVEELAKGLDGAQKPQLLEFLRQPVMQLVVQTIVLLCFITFPTAYIWYARSTKRI